MMETYNSSENNEEESFSYLKNDDGNIMNSFQPIEKENNTNSNLGKILEKLFKNDNNTDIYLTTINMNNVYFINQNKSTKPESSKDNNKNIEKCTQENDQNELENKEKVNLQKPISIAPSKENKIKTYEDKKGKRKSKKIFTILKKDGFIKKKAIIRINENKKVGYKIKIKSRRVDNIKEKIKRNIIQDIIPNWINCKEKNLNNILQKLNPSKIKDIYKTKNEPIEKIFKSDITLKGNIDKQHNINIINNNANNLKKIKFKFTLIEIMNVIIDKNKREQILSKKMPELKEKEERERKALINEFFEGLKGIEEYLNEIDGSACYKNKIKECFFEISQY